MTVWEPVSEEDLLALLESGDGVENHSLDFKAQLGDKDSSRRETARDLASFSINGGTIILGVAEGPAGVFSLAPVELPGLSERVEQVAANRIDPPLHIRTREIRSHSAADRGYLVVHVPPSPGAPHMVEGVYWGRSEKTKRRLSDAEVLLLHATRRSSDDRVLLALEEEVDREPGPRIGGRLFLVAEPLQAPEGMGRTFVRGRPIEVRKLLDSTTSDLPASVAGCYPLVHDLTSTVRRAKGIASTNLSEGRTASDEYEVMNATDIEVQISGSVRALVSAQTYETDIPRISGPVTVINDALPVAWTHVILGAARHLGLRSGYSGPWGVGVRIVNIQGVRASEGGFLKANALPVYERSSYQSTTTASSDELENARGAIAERLLGDLLHSLGVSDRYGDALGKDEVESG